MEELKKKLQDEIAVLENELRVELPREILKARAPRRPKRERRVSRRQGAPGNGKCAARRLRAAVAEFSMVDMSKIPR